MLILYPYYLIRSPSSIRRALYMLDQADKSETFRYCPGRNNYIRGAAAEKALVSNHNAVDYMRKSYLINPKDQLTSLGSWKHISMNCFLHSIQSDRL